MPRPCAPKLRCNDSSSGRRQWWRRLHGVSTWSAPRRHYPLGTGPSWAIFSTTTRQGLTLVHVRAQLQQLQDTFTSQIELYGGQKSSS